MDSTRLVAVVGLLVALSVATERLCEIVKDLAEGILGMLKEWGIGKALRKGGQWNKLPLVCADNFLDRHHADYQTTSIGFGRGAAQHGAAADERPQAGARG